MEEVMAIQPAKAFMNVDEMAEMLGVSKSCIYHYISRNTIQYHKIGGAVKFTPEDVEAIKKDTLVKAKRRKHKSANKDE